GPRLEPLHSGRSNLDQIGAPAARSVVLVDDLEVDGRRVVLDVRAVVFVRGGVEGDRAYVERAPKRRLGVDGGDVLELEQHRERSLDLPTERDVRGRLEPGGGRVEVDLPDRPVGAGAARAGELDGTARGSLRAEPDVRDRELDDPP